MPMVETVWTWRTQWTCRALFIFNVHLIAIFRPWELWGLKSPAICLFFLTGQQRRWRAGDMWLVHSNITRAFWLFSSMIFVFHILFLLIIMITGTNAWFSGKWGGRSLLGPEFDSQVHQNFYIVLFNMITCRFSNASYHALPAVARQVATKVNPKARDGGSWCSSVNYTMDNSKSQTWLVC